MILLNLKLAQNRTHVHCKQKSVLFVSLEISPDETTKFIQRNHHVALVIDCSGSMDGKKIDDAKDAAINVVRRLSPNDLVSIVTFETEVQVMLNPTPASDPNIENVIRSIDVGGATALHGGILTGLELLRQASAPNMINRLEVFSDGEPNVVPYDDNDFVELSKALRNEGMTMDVFGIGDDYNGPLLMTIAECGGGKWEHVENTNALTTILNTQMTEMQNTIISNPQLQLTFLDGAELAAIAITKPTLQQIESKDQQRSGNMISIGIKDIIKDQSQIVAMRIAVPPIEGENVSLLTAIITEGNNQVANQTATISCTDDKELFNLETDPNPRVLLSGAEATVLLRQGIDGDPEATEMAKTIIQSLNDPETTKMLDEDAHATLIHAGEVSGEIKEGMTEAEKKKVLHDTTVIETKPTTQQASPQQLGNSIKCPKCGEPAKGKFCGKCGENINNNEVSE